MHENSYRDVDVDEVLEGGLEGGNDLLASLAGTEPRGLLFEDSFSATNITNPSHMALLTGLEVRDHQIIANGTPLTEHALTLAEVFQAAGWRTLGCPVLSSGGRSCSPKTLE